MRVNNGIPYAVLVMFLPLSAQAAEYSVTPFGTATAEADTNKRLATQDTDTTFGALLDVGALFNASNEESSLSVTPRLSIGRFSDDGNNVDQDTEDYFLDMTGNHRINERLSAGAFLNFANTGVIGSELEDLGIVFGDNNVASLGLENINENFSRQTISAGPSLTYILSEKDSLSFGASYSEGTYDNQNTILSDYTNYSINASWIRQVSVQDQFSVSVFASKQDPDLNALELASIQSNLAPQTLNDETDQTGITFGYMRSFSDSLTGNVSIGVRKSEGEFPDLTDFDIRLSPTSAATLQAFRGGPVTTLINRLDPILTDNDFLTSNPTFLTGSSRANNEYRQGIIDSTGFLFDASLEKQYERTTVTAGLSRASLPSGRGLTERDELYLNGIHLFSDRLTGNGSIRYFSTQSENEETLVGINGGATDQFRLEAGLDWRWTEFWTVGTGYTYSRRSGEIGASADGHGVFVSVGYNGNRYAISR